jgi:RNA polymerase sigma factor (sigma-70 family)
MRDSEIVAAIVAGNPEGLAAAYDRYAPVLYAYCRSLLTEPDDAADAVQDTFIVAASKLAGLRDRDRLRPWLYAVARNECYRKLRASARAVGLDEADDVTDDSAEVSVSAERAELRELVSAAIAGLNSGERELIELNLRHDLQGADLADALGVSVNYAHALASRARNQFETSLGALLVARSGRGSCAALDGLLAGWDGRLTVLLRKRLNRHIEKCDICGDRKRRELRPAMLLGLLPVAALPDSVRRQVFRLVSDDTGRQASSYRARVVRRSEPFNRSGFPVPVQRPGPTRLNRRYALAAVAAVALFATLGGTVVAVDMLQSGAPPAAAAPHSSPATAPPASAATPPSTTPPTSATPSATVTPAPSATVAAAPPPTTPVATPQPSPSRSRTPRPPPTRTPPPPPPPGTLNESPAAVTLVPPDGGGAPTGSFTLTANGGPVASYTVTVPGSLAPDLVVTPSSGSLAAGESVTITVTWNGEGSVSASLTVDPGGLQVSVSYQVIG